MVPCVRMKKRGMALEKGILIVYGFINLLAFVLMSYDKRMAITGGWRIPERVLLGLSALGGAAGSFVAMRMWRHKTLKPKFSAGLPLMLLAHMFLFFRYIK